jgi:hypothetical protein
LSAWGLIFSFWVYEESAHSSVSQFFIFGLGALLSGIIIYLQLPEEKNK